MNLWQTTSKAFKSFYKFDTQERKALENQKAYQRTLHFSEDSLGRSARACYLDMVARILKAFRDWNHVVNETSSSPCSRKIYARVHLKSWETAALCNNFNCDILVLAFFTAGVQIKIYFQMQTEQTRQHK